MRGGRQKNTDFIVKWVKKCSTIGGGRKRKAAAVWCSSSEAPHWIVATELMHSHLQDMLFSILLFWFCFWTLKASVPSRGCDDIITLGLTIPTRLREQVLWLGSLKRVCDSFGSKAEPEIVLLRLIFYNQMTFVHDFKVCVCVVRAHPCFYFTLRYSSLSNLPFAVHTSI